MKNWLWQFVIMYLLVNVAIGANVRTSHQQSGRGAYARASRTPNEVPSPAKYMVFGFTAPEQLQPANGATNIPLVPEFRVATVAGAFVYYFEIATDEGFSNIISSFWQPFTSATPGDSTVTLAAGIEYPSDFVNNATYYWRARVTDSTGASSSPWSATESYVTQPTSAPVATPVLTSPASYSTLPWIGVEFDWESGSGATSYMLQWGEPFASSWNYRWFDNGETNFSSDLLPNSTYYTKVLGYNNGSVSPYSNSNTFYTGNQEVLTASSGTFDDGSGPANYQGGENLSWLIEPPTAQQITLSFSSFFTVSGVDYVTVYDGPTSSSPVLGKFSGETLPANVTSSTGVMLVEFTTGYFSETDRGWVATYTSSLNQGVIKSGTLAQLTNGPGQTPYEVPPYSTAYVYFTITSGGSPVNFSQQFQLGLTDQASNAYTVQANITNAGTLRISVPSSFVSNSGTSTFTVSDSIQIGDSIYVLSAAAPSFQISLISQDCSRTIDCFAQGTAGVSAIVGGVGLGASIAAAKLTVSGTGGMGLTASVDADNNLTLSRRLLAGASASLAIPSVDAVLAQASIINAGLSSDLVVGQYISTAAMTNLNADQKKMAEAGFLIETLTRGFTGFSPLVGPFVNAIDQTLLGAGVAQNVEDAVVQNSSGLDFQGSVSLGFESDVTIPPAQLSLTSENSTFSGVFSMRGNTFPEGIPGFANVKSSYSFSDALSFDFSTLSFGLNNDQVELGSNNFSVFDVGLGMECGLEAFFASGNEFDHLNIWLSGGGGIVSVGQSAQTYYQTVIQFPQEYGNALSSGSFGIAGLLKGGGSLAFGQLPSQMPAMLSTASNGFINNPILITTYENDSYGMDYNFGISLDGALGAGLGLSFGFDATYFDEVSYARKYTAVYANRQSYLLYSSNAPSPNVSNFSIGVLYDTLFTGAASLVSTAFQNLIKSIGQDVAAGENAIVNGVDQAGNFVGSVGGDIEQSGQWWVSTFSAAFPHPYYGPFQKMVIRNTYSSTRVLHHKSTIKSKTFSVNASTLYAVSEDMKVSFIPTGQSGTIDSSTTPFMLKLLMDTAQLNANGFTLADARRASIFSFDTSANAWTSQGGTIVGDTVEVSATRMANYIVGIERNSAQDTIPPSIFAYGARVDSATGHQLIYANITDNQFGVGVDWAACYIVVHGDTLSCSYNPGQQMMFFDVSGDTSLHDTVSISVYASDYNGNTSSVRFTFVVTGVPIKRNTPFRFNLGQNYPNPFNPTTKFDLSIAKESEVTVLVFNSIGQYITTLIDKRMTAGNYTLNFNGSRLSSGVYFCSLVAKPMDGSAEYRVTKKMALIK